MGGDDARGRDCQLQAAAAAVARAQAHVLQQDAPREPRQAQLRVEGQVAGAGRGGAPAEVVDAGGPGAQGRRAAGVMIIAIMILMIISKMLYVEINNYNKVKKLWQRVADQKFSVLEILFFLFIVIIINK